MTADDLAASFKNSLDTHGYGFHYAALKACEEASKAQDLPWYFEAAEFPVECGGSSTRIDFVLRTGQAVLVAECKRANPALATWCFVKAPYVARRASVKDVRLERFWRESTTGRVHSQPAESRGYRDQYQLAFEMRTGQKGDTHSIGRGAVDDAVAQVIRGAHGLLNYVGASKGLFDSQPMFVVPVILTTAQLLCSDVDLTETDLATGNTELGTLTPRPWLWFQHNVSSHLEHSLPKYYGKQPLNSLAQMLRFRHARSIAIVSTTGIPHFLRQLVDEFEDFQPAEAIPR